MLTEFQLWVLSATEIVALYIVCVMLLRAVIPGQIKWAPKCLAYGALNRLAGVWGRAGCLNPTALLTAKLSLPGEEQPSVAKIGRLLPSVPAPWKADMVGARKGPHRSLWVCVWLLVPTKRHSQLKLRAVPRIRQPILGRAPIGATSCFGGKHKESASDLRAAISCFENSVSAAVGAAVRALPTQRCWALYLA